MEEFILREERKKMGNRDKEGKGKGNNESNKKVSNGAEKL